MAIDLAAKWLSGGRSDKWYQNPDASNHTEVHDEDSEAGLVRLVWCLNGQKGPNKQIKRDKRIMEDFFPE